ncbi:MAG: arginine--tRNA ligase, partial [Candidatus Marinimicrobia bacterium]|nr:arginine--tRNA ligase [Candidatus Neomarinimicrobiota bacterium]
MIKDLKELLENTVRKIYAEKIGNQQIDFSVERPKNDDHGDFSSNIAMKLASVVRDAPLNIAKKIVESVSISNTEIEKIEAIRPGFINIFIKDSYYQNIIEEVLESNSQFRKTNIGSGKKVQVEFVSANPTGPLTVGHGRQAVLGDTVSNILEWHGFDVVREYYFNDAGRQMRLLGESLFVRYMEFLGENLEIPQDGYQGEYIKDIAKLFFEKYGEKYKNQSDNQIFI